MKHSVKATVIDKKVYPELQERYLADPESGVCTCFEEGDKFLFERADEPETNEEREWLESHGFCIGEDDACTGA